MISRQIIKYFDKFEISIYRAVTTRKNFFKKS